MRAIMVLLAALAALSIGAAPAMAQDDADPARMEMKKIAEDVYFLENSRGSSNAVFVVTPDGVLVFDADLRTADQVLAAIRKTTDKKVRYIVTSHSAGDHATGIWVYREDKPIYIATRKQMRDLMMQESKEFAERKASTRPQDAPYKNAELVLPDIAFEGAMTLRFGGLTFQITEEGSAHSTSDVTVYIPQRRVFLMGDLLDTEIHPGQGESAGVFFSNVKNWIILLDNIMAPPVAGGYLCARARTGACRPRRGGSGRAEEIFRHAARRSLKDDRCRQKRRTGAGGVQGPGGVRPL